MLVTRQLSEEIDKLLPQMQQNLAQEARQILKSVGEVVPKGKEAIALISAEDINILLKHEIKIWRREYGKTGNSKGS